MSEEIQDRTAARQLSRRELRRLREAGETPEVPKSSPAEGSAAGAAPEYAEDLQALHEDVAAASTGDPTAVDPELKRRQDEMAERALRENRARWELSAEPEADTRTVRAVGDALEEPVTADSSGDDSSGDAESIRPVEASTAHGLDLESAAEESSRSAARRNRLVVLLLVVIVILLLVVAGVFLLSS